MHAKGHQGHVGAGQLEAGEAHEEAHAGRKHTGDQDGQYRRYMKINGQDGGAIGAHDKKGHLAE